MRQSAEPWKLMLMAREAALLDAAIRELRRPSARNCDSRSTALMSRRGLGFKLEAGGATKCADAARPSRRAGH